MHEAALAQGLLAILLEEAGRHALTSIRRVRVKVGRLKAVEPHALAYCFEAFSAGTIAEGAQVVIEHVAVEARCKDCGQRFEVAGFRFRCGHCGGQDVEILHGEELYVESFDA